MIRVRVIATGAVEEIRAAAGQLTLQMIVFSDAPLACIDGHVIKTGSRIAGFEVIRIASHQVILQREGVPVALTMD